MPEEKPSEPKEQKRTLIEEPPVITRHQIKIGSETLKYTVTTGMMPLKTEFGEHEANVFFMAYTKDGARKKRPLMFSFNGGPGSASLWLHLGALGPKRVKLLDDGMMPAPPYTLVDNPQSWLTETDIVFLDPVGTGYSRPVDKETGKKFWGVKGDIESIGEVIRLYLTRFERWDSPLFLVGESYGTTRAAGLAGHLIDKGVAFNGIVLVSSILNFLTARFIKGNDLPYILFLPTYCATAHFHGKITGRLRDLLRDCEHFAAGEYTQLLAKGDNITAAEKKRLIERVSHFTGLSKEFVDNCNMRVNIHQFCKELLRDEKRTVGRLDSRFKGMDALATGEVPEHDPSMTAIRPPYTSMINDYIRTQLNYKTDLNYNVLGEGVEEPWDWGNARDGYPDTSEALRAAFAKNPHMRVFVASGYYDLATPYFATQYTLAHMGLDPSLRDRIRTEYYPAGHMMYVHTKCLADLKNHVAEFIEDAV
jgi:carboxypeptidase C (cathepsin A)